jgi:hypothetical protein
VGWIPLSDQNASDQNALGVQEDTEGPMFTIEHSIGIQRPVAAVFAYVAQLARARQRLLVVARRLRPHATCWSACGSDGTRS